LHFLIPKLSCQHRLHRGLVFSFHPRPSLSLSLALDGFPFRYRQQLRIRLAARSKPHPCTTTVMENFSFFACTDSPAGGMRMSASRVRITTRFSYS
jgi:hypothetical protein